jgi:hypothetical protein
MDKDAVDTLLNTAFDKAALRTGIRKEPPQAPKRAAQTPEDLDGFMRLFEAARNDLVDLLTGLQKAPGSHFTFTVEGQPNNAGTTIKTNIPRHTHERVHEVHFWLPQSFPSGAIRPALFGSSTTSKAPLSTAEDVPQAVAKLAEDIVLAAVLQGLVPIDGVRLNPKTVKPAAPDGGKPSQR